MHVSQWLTNCELQHHGEPGKIPKGAVCHWHLNFYTGSQ